MEYALKTIEIPYKVHFTNKEPIPIDAVVESLLAYEKLLKRVGPFIEQAYEGIYVEDIEVLLSKIESGSLFEDFLVKVVFGSEETKDKAIEVAAEMFENNKVLTTAVCIGVGAYIAFGVHNAVIKQSGATAPVPHIEAQYGAIVQTGGTMNISEDVIKQILNKTRDKATLSKEAINAVAPAHLDPKASIRFNDMEAIDITPGFVDETPKKYEPPEKEKDNEVVLKVDIEIWASDRESQVKSWAGIVPGKIEKRIKFKLDEAVDPESLHGNTRVQADIKIEWSLPPGKKEFVPTAVEILRVYKK